MIFQLQLVTSKDDLEVTAVTFKLQLAVTSFCPTEESAYDVWMLLKIGV